MIINWPAGTISADCGNKKKARGINCKNSNVTHSHLYCTAVSTCHCEVVRAADLEVLPRGRAFGGNALEQGEAGTRPLVDAGEVR